MSNLPDNLITLIQITNEIHTQNICNITAPLGELVSAHCSQSACSTCVLNGDRIDLTIVEQIINGHS